MRDVGENATCGDAWFYPPLTSQIPLKALRSMQLVSNPILKGSHMSPTNTQRSALRDLPQGLPKGPEEILRQETL